MAPHVGSFGRRDRTACVAVAFLLAILALSTAGDAAPAPFPVIGKIAPDFVLIDQDDQLIRVSQFRGKLILLNFIYTHCPDVCPLTTAALARAQRELMRRRWWETDVVFLTVTTDPLHDTPTVLRTYAGRYKADLRGWRFLTGNPETIRPVYAQYGIDVYPRGGTLQDHASPTFVIDRGGRVLGAYGANPDPEAILHDLAELRART